MDRTLDWAGCRNVRELGGLPIRRGGETARRVLVRADSLSRLTPIGVRAVVGHGVGTVLDLREAALVASGPHPLAGSEGVRYLHVPLLPEGFPLPVPVDAHEDALVAAQPQMPRLVSAIVAEPAVTVVHCHSGTGRTGLASLVLLSLAGVVRSALVKDYLESIRSDAAPLGAATRAAEDVIRHLDRCGGAAAYLATGGASAADIGRLRAQLKAETPWLR